jgi:hypothetical protein
VKGIKFFFFSILGLTILINNRALATEAPDESKTQDHNTLTTEPLDYIKFLGQDSAVIEQPVPQKTVNSEDFVFKAELRGAAFIPMCTQFTKIYGSVGPSLQLEMAGCRIPYRYLELWGNIEWDFLDKNKSHLICGNTNINIINLSIGLKGIGNVYHDSIFLYAGIGPDLGIALLENTCSSEFLNFDFGDFKLKENVCKVGFGVSIKMGGQFYFTRKFYLDIFADYLYLPISYSHSIDVGGFKIGAGLGGRF